MADQKQFAPTPASQWTDPHPAQEVTLPSGNRAIIKRPNFYILGRSGLTPAKVDAAQKRAKAAGAKAAAAKAAPTTPEDIVERLEDVEVMVNWSTTKAFLKPVVTLIEAEADPDKDIIHVSHLSADDKSFVLEVLKIEV